MKSNKLVVALLVSLISFGAVAQFSPETGGSAGAIHSVQEVKKMKDDAPVVLVGRITKSLGDEKYTFEDQSGSITVEIDHEVFQGKPVNPSNTVRLEGEVDTGLTSKTSVDVHHLVVVK